ncbi:O-methyltransferase (plasmid) [Halorussus salilacus]|uniref:O-methyltransferase n=1 Tax=Halorussus salilacus TaxID=2953750 RepID=UPI00209D8C12|nr:O-methyltransferase [Halorussus salilacus]USZ69763.1 O-methyltransferase [Halorussus salilacus]
MTEILPDETERFVRAMVTETDETLAEMEAHGEEIGFPTVGPEVGAFLRLAARMVDASRIFEFGSGFGYSAYWFAEALPEDGEIVLTEHDPDELERAREFLARGGYADRATFEDGDALETIARYDGPFDVVLVDCHKRGYPDALDAVAEKVADGGVIIADNAMESGIQDFETILEILEGGDPEGADEDTRGIAEYLLAVRDDEAFDTAAIPLGEGIAVSYRR